MADDVIDSSDGSETFIDGFLDVRIAEGVVRIALFRKPDDVRIIVERIVAPVTALPDMIQMLAIALARINRGA